MLLAHELRQTADVDDQRDVWGLVRRIGRDQKQRKWHSRETDPGTKVLIRTESYLGRVDRSGIQVENILHVKAGEEFAARPRFKADHVSRPILRVPVTHGCSCEWTQDKLRLQDHEFCRHPWGPTEKVPCRLLGHQAVPAEQSDWWREVGVGESAAEGSVDSKCYNLSWINDYCWNRTGRDERRGLGDGVHSLLFWNELGSKETIQSRPNLAWVLENYLRVHHTCSLLRQLGPRSVQ